MSIKILLADDHQITREGLRRMLNEQADFTVVGEAGDGRSAVDLAARLTPDVVVMDVTMPELNGVEATRQIKRDSARTKVLVLSMHGDRQFVTEMLEAGATGYLLKDCPAEEFVRAVRAVAGGTTYLSPKVQEVLVHSVMSPSTAAKGSIHSLSPREREVIQLVAEGKNTKEIAFSLHLSTKTVETHRRQAMAKLNVNTIAELTRYAIRTGMTSLG